MNYNHPQIQKAVHIIHIVVGFLFCLFSFLYLWKVQGGVIGMAQHVLSGGQTVYSPLVGAIVLTIALFVLQKVLNRFFRLRRELYALSFFPSFLCMACLTDVAASAYSGISMGGWKLGLPLAFVIFILFILILKRFPNRSNSHVGGVEVRLFLPNAISLLLLAIMTCVFSNTDEKIHQQYKIEYCLMNNDYEGALKVGKKSNQANQETTALRAYALSKRNELGEHLFEYPQLYGPEGLLIPRADSVHMVFNPDSLYYALGAYPRYHKEPAMEFLTLLKQAPHQAIEPMAGEYYLCGLLLDKRLQDFVETLPDYYVMMDSVALPHYYEEALVLYSRQGYYTEHLDSLLDSQYEKYDSIKVSAKNAKQAANLTMNDYQHTYWWYYDFANKK